MSLWRRFSKNSVHDHNFYLEPGQVQETRDFMRVPGTIDVSRLEFHAMPYDVPIPGDVNETYIDIAVFPLSSHKCRNSGQDCDLSELGVGKVEAFEGTSFVSLCHRGRLALQHNQDNFYHGYHTTLAVPKEGPMSSHFVHHGQYAVNEVGVGYEVMVANCNEYGRKIKVKGEVVFDFTNKSTADYKHQEKDVVFRQLGLPFLFVAFSVCLFLSTCFIRVRCPSSRRRRLQDTAELALDRDIDLT